MKGLTVLITGASGGLGRAICRALAKEGVNLVLFGGTNAVIDEISLHRAGKQPFLG